MELPDLLLRNSGTDLCNVVRALFLRLLVLRPELPFQRGQCFLMRPLKLHGACPRCVGCGGFCVGDPVSAP